MWGNRGLILRPALVVPALVIPALVVPGVAGAAGRPLPVWTLVDTGSYARLRGLAAVSRDVAWASGSGGTVLRTVDGGRSWRPVGPPGTADLQFRDIEA